MTETRLVESMREVQERYRVMGVDVDPKTLAVLVVNHALGDYRKYKGNKEYWSNVRKVESWLTST